MYKVAAKLLLSDIISVLSLVAIQALNRIVLDNAMHSSVVVLLFLFRLTELSLLKNAFLPMVIAILFLNKRPV